MSETFIKPDFERLRKVLLRTGEPDCVPLADISVHRLIKEGFLGRPIRNVADEVAFWYQAGYNAVPVEQGLQLTQVIQKDSFHPIQGQYAADTSEMQTRSWATEGKGLITKRADFDSFRWPDPDALDYSIFEKTAALLPPRMKIIAVMGKIFTCVWWLMGLEGMSMALVDDPDLVRRVFDKVGDFQFRVFQNMLRFDSVGLFWHADDIAFSTQLMVSPAILREHLFPRYQEMNRLTHEKGKLAVFHSDGALQAVMEDIIACGFDGLNPIEPKAMDINEMKRKYGARISLLGNIDLIYTLTRGTPEEVRAEVRRRIHDLAPGGGYAVASANSIPEYVPLANFKALRDATFEFGKYPIAA
ncbi:MAG TPA: uroporphyrinogen decarboxylase family protein [Thermodesulfobacteriota bacterium]|nr:uroporphyrinogen decarboxylase family protein [Thermodesulfobacteriota bacterium]